MSGEHTRCRTTEERDLGRDGLGSEIRAFGGCGIISAEVRVKSGAV